MPDITKAPLHGEIEERDEFEAYSRKVEATDPTFRESTIARTAAYARYGFQQWKRAKAANRRADNAERAVSAYRDNLRDAWAALRMIREAVETLGPVGAMPAEEHLDGPTLAHEAEAIVAGIMKLRDA